MKQIISGMVVLFLTAFCQATSVKDIMYFYPNELRPEYNVLMHRTLDDSMNPSKGCGVFKVTCCFNRKEPTYFYSVLNDVEISFLKRLYERVDVSHEEKHPRMWCVLRRAKNSNFYDSEFKQSVAVQQYVSKLKAKKERPSTQALARIHSQHRRYVARPPTIVIS